MVIKGEYKEFEGATVEEAIQKASEVLGATRDQMDVKIVCEEHRGLFGMRGVSPAKIKACKKG